MFVKQNKNCVKYEAEIFTKVSLCTKTNSYQISALWELKQCHKNIFKISDNSAKKVKGHNSIENFHPTGAKMR